MVLAPDNINTLVGSVKQVLDRRIILGDEVSSEIIVLFNTLTKTLDYCLAQYVAGNLEYSTKIKTLDNLLLTLRYECPSICNYYIEFGSVQDFKASNAVISIDTTKYNISQLQIIT
jgi:hypothetical protein